MSSKDKNCPIRIRQIVDTRSNRLDRFFKQLLTVMSVYMAGMVIGIIVMVLNMVYPQTFGYATDLVNDIIQYSGMFAGFLIAELVRRSTVNQDTEELRPYTWRELFGRF